MKALKRIYCISGLGADHRVFANIHIEGYELVAVLWVKPAKGEPLATYAMRLCEQIPEQAPVIIGLSLGGMLASEIAKLKPEARVFIVSSACTAKELVFNGVFTKWLATAGAVPPVTMIPARLIFYLGGHTKEERNLLYRMFVETDPNFISWGIKAILLWENAIRPANVYHIHGTSDRLILPGFVHADAWVKDGSHFLIYDHAAEVNEIISRELQVQQ
jgi:pimeloyl-ACP methyl ester carboxylesterase